MHSMTFLLLAFLPACTTLVALLATVIVGLVCYAPTSAPDMGDVDTSDGWAHDLNREMSAPLAESTPHAHAMWELDYIFGVVHTPTSGATVAKGVVTAPLPRRMRTGRRVCDSSYWAGPWATGRCTTPDVGNILQRC